MSSATHTKDVRGSTTTGAAALPRWSEVESRLWVAELDGDLVGTVEFYDGHFVTCNGRGVELGSSSSLPATRCAGGAADGSRASGAPRLRGRRGGHRGAVAQHDDRRRAQLVTLEVVERSAGTAPRRA
jgi:hypothetical protein